MKGKFSSIFRLSVVALSLIYVGCSSEFFNPVSALTNKKSEVEKDVEKQDQSAVDSDDGCYDPFYNMDNLFFATKNIGKEAAPTLYFKKDDQISILVQEKSFFSRSGASKIYNAWYVFGSYGRQGVLFEIIDYIRKQTEDVDSMKKILIDNLNLDLSMEPQEGKSYYAVFLDENKAPYNVSSMSMKRVVMTDLDDKVVEDGFYIIDGDENRLEVDNCTIKKKIEELKPRRSKKGKDPLEEENLEDLD